MSDGRCQNSPAADHQTTVKNAGKSIMAISTPERSPSASATRMTARSGSGAAASIRDRIPGEHQSGTAASFDEARADFESAWKIFLSKRTEADFRKWRDQRDWTAEKYRRFERGERMPPDWQPSAQ
jgi:hypothetical protein